MFHLKAFGLVCTYITECLWVLFALLRIIFPHKCVELEPLKAIKQEGENMDFQLQLNIAACLSLSLFSALFILLVTQRSGLKFLWFTWIK